MTQVPTPNYASPNSGEVHQNGLGVAAMICGIVTLLLALFPGCNLFLALPLALVTLGLGIAGWVIASGKPNQKSTFAIIGVVAAIVAVIMVFVVNTLAGAAVSSWGQGMVNRGQIVSTVEADAETAASEARARGVSPAVVNSEMQKFQTEISKFAMDTVGGDADEMQEKADAALKTLKDNLDAAPVTTPPGDTTGDGTTSGTP